MKSWLEQHFVDEAAHCRVWSYDHLPSTNTLAKELAAAGAADGTIVIAGEQSAGRGRMQRSFFSPGGTGLYMSIIVRRDLLATEALRLTTTAAVATAQAIETMGRTADIKWVNDIYLDGKKVCGILTEGAVKPGTQCLDYAVIGIGVNVVAPREGFPEEIKSIAGALFLQTEDAGSVLRELALGIIQRLMKYLQSGAEQEIYSEYCRRSIAIGKEITVHQGDGRAYPARVLSIDPSYRLIVRTPDGKEISLDSGEVSIKI